MLIYHPLPPCYQIIILSSSNLGFSLSQHTRPAESQKECQSGPSERSQRGMFRGLSPRGFQSSSRSVCCGGTSIKVIENQMYSLRGEIYRTLPTQPIPLYNHSPYTCSARRRAGRLCSLGAIDAVCFPTPTWSLPCDRRRVPETSPTVWSALVRQRSARSVVALPVNIPSPVLPHVKCR